MQLPIASNRSVSEPRSRTTTAPEESMRELNRHLPMPSHPTPLMVDMVVLETYLDCAAGYPAKTGLYQ